MKRSYSFLRITIRFHLHLLHVLNVGSGGEGEAGGLGWGGKGVYKYRGRDGC